MLIFKNNLYSRNEPGPGDYFRSPDPGFENGFDAAHFLTRVLTEEEETLRFLERQPREYWAADGRKFYPISHKAGGFRTLHRVLTILCEGHADAATWYHMNAYHLSFLHDAMARYVFNYNLDNNEEKTKALPELSGRSIDFAWFVKNYFPGTQFLIGEEEFDRLSAEDKRKKGFVDPCLFAVIHGLSPTREELKLQAASDFPYSIYV